MSCFETSDQSKSNLARRLAAETNAAVREYAAENGLASAAEWYGELVEWNRDSLRNRYGDEFDAVGPMPVPAEICDAQYLKSLHCLMYQCTEAGDGFNALNGAIRALADEIEAENPGLVKTPEYQAAEWD